MSGKTVRTWLWGWLWVALGSVGCAQGLGPQFGDVPARTGRVNQPLQVQIPVINDEPGLVVVATWNRSRNNIPNPNARVNGRLFSWTPEPTHNGSNLFTLSLQRGVGGVIVDTAQLPIQVIADGTLRPVFRLPASSGTYDLNLTPCVDFPVEVSDQDDETIDLAAPVIPPGATFTPGFRGKTGQFRWCPSEHQIQNLTTFEVELTARDASELVRHRHRIVLINSAAAGQCSSDGGRSIATARNGINIQEGTVCASAADYYRLEPGSYFRFAEATLTSSSNLVIEAVKDDNTLLAWSRNHLIVGCVPEGAAWYVRIRGETQVDAGDYRVSFTYGECP